MGTSAKRPAPTGIATQSNCSGHEDCQTGKCNHTRKLWDLKSPTPGAHYEKKRRTARLARSRGKRPRPRSTDRGFTLIELLIVLAIVGILVFTALTLANRKPTEAVEVLETNGFTDVKVLDKTYFAAMKGCAEDDQIAYSCEATNPVGKRVRVTVCTGWLKGGTVRVGGGW